MGAPGIQCVCNWLEYTIQGCDSVSAPIIQPADSCCAPNPQDRSTCRKVKSAQNMTSKRRSGPTGSPEDYPDTPDPKRRKRNDVSHSTNSLLYFFPPDPISFIPPTPNCLDFCRTRYARSPAQQSYHRAPSQSCPHCSRHVLPHLTMTAVQSSSLLQLR